MTVMPERLKRNVPCNLNFLNGLFNQFSDDNVASCQKDEIATGNEVYVVTATNNQSYVIRILKTQGAQNARVEAKIQRRLLAAQIGTPRYLPLKNGHLVGAFDSGCFTISDLVEGKRPEMVSKDVIADFGSTLARIHDALKCMVVPANDMQWLNPTHVKRNLDGCTGAMRLKFSELFADSAELFRLDLPKSVVHGDLIIDNVFVSGGEITCVFDFETAEHTFRILDLARTYLSLRNDTEHSGQVILSGLVAGYDESAEKRLIPEELDYLGLAIKFANSACGAWCATHGSMDSAMKYLNLAAHV